MYIFLGLAIAFVVFTINPTYAQHKEQFKFNHKAVYQMTYLPDSLDQHVPKQLMTELLLGDGHSLFRSSQKAYTDSLYSAYIATKVITMSAPTIIPIGEINPFNYQIIKDYSSGQVKVYDEYTGASLNNLKEISYYFEPQENLFNWTIKSDTATINEQLCQRADIDFGGRKWTAWFALDLAAFSDGPYKFSGLPGLIIRVYDAKKSWNFDLVELSKIDTLLAINFKEGLNFKETTKKQLYNNRKNFQKNQLEIKETAGTYFGENRTNGKNILEAFIQRDNNWIELDF